MAEVQVLGETFVRGSDAIREQFSRRERRAVCCGTFWRPVGPPCPTLWPDYPFVYRILSGPGGKHGINEGTGLQGIMSRSMYLNREKPVPRRSQVVSHVKENPLVTPWISTSFNLSTQEGYIRRKFRLRLWSPETQVQMVKIDVRYLGPSYGIVNLSHEPTRDALMLNDNKARMFAQRWDEVLIFWQVPMNAVVSNRCYWYNPLRDVIDWFELSNPIYGFGLRPCCPRQEDFSLDLLK